MLIHLFVVMSLDMLRIPKAYAYSSFSSNVFPEGLPPSYVFVSTQRFKVKKMWDLWRILTIDGRPQIAVTLNGVDKTLLFTTTSMINGSQVVTFVDPQVKVKMLGYDYDDIHGESPPDLCVGGRVP